MILPDINVWLALAYDRHQNYSSARGWFEGLPGELRYNVWNDAYLAAFSVAGDYELVTFDKGFAQSKNLRHTILS